MSDQRSAGTRPQGRRWEETWCSRLEGMHPGEMQPPKMETRVMVLETKVELQRRASDHLMLEVETGDSLCCEELMA